MTATPDELIAEIFGTAEGKRDPYPRYRAIREQAPVHQGPGDIWYLSRFDDCRTALLDPRLGKTPPEVEPPSLDGRGASRTRGGTEEPGTRSLLFLNPPDHTRLRGLVAREFTPKRIDDLRPRIDELTVPLLDRMAESGEVDVMEALAWRLPATVISELVGVPAAEREEFRSVVRDIIVLLEVGAAPEAYERGLAAGARMREYFTGLVARKRAEPQDDLLSALIAVEEAGDRLTEAELITTMILLFAAGFETTTNLIGNGLWLLLRHPDQMALLREDPALLPGFIEEALRFEAPVQLNARYVFEDVEIGGQVIPAGSTAVEFLGGANRDPARFDDPETFDITRADNQPLSFGFGIHHCLGAHLARAEGRAVFAALLDRFATIEATEADPPWRGFTLRGLERLPVRVA
jgi:cytochrome P450